MKYVNTGFIVFAAWNFASVCASAAPLGQTVRAPYKVSAPTQAMSEVRLEDLERAFTGPREEAKKLPDYLELHWMTRDKVIADFRFENQLLSVAHIDDPKSRQARDALAKINQWTEKQFRLDPELVEEQIAITILGPVDTTVHEAYIAFLLALTGKGLNTRLDGDVILIYRPEQAAPRVKGFDPKAQVDTTPFIPLIRRLEHIQCVKAHPLIRPVLSQQAKLVSFKPRNAFIAFDHPAGIELFMRVMDLLDVPKLEHQLYVFRMRSEYAQPGEESLDHEFGDNKRKEKFNIIYGEKDAPKKFSNGGIANRVILNGTAERLVLSGDSKGNVHLKVMISQAYRPQAWANPSSSVSNPIGFGLDWGDIAFGVGYFFGGTLSGQDDLVLFGAFGIGRYDIIALDVIVGVYDVVNEDRTGLTFGIGGISLKLHRYLGKGWSLGVGRENVLNWGDQTFTVKSDYVVLSKLVKWWETASDEEWFNSTMFTLGLGNGIFRKSDDIRLGRNNWNPFVSIGQRMIGPVGFNADSDFEDIDLGISIAPIRRQQLNIDFAVMNVLEKGRFGRYYLLTLAYSLDLTPHDR